MPDRFAEFSVHGDANADAWLWHEPCRTELDAINDPWTLTELVASAHRHLAECDTDIADAPPSAMEREMDAHIDLLSQLYLYVDWRWLTKQIETEHKERWATAVEAWSAKLNEGTDEQPKTADRWWLCPTCGINIRAKLEDGPHVSCILAGEVPRQ